MLQKADSLLTQQMEFCKVTDVLATPSPQVELESQLSQVQMHLLP